MTPSDLQVIVLAAGSASRFGSPKLLAEIGGRPMLIHALETLLGVVQRDQVVVVLGAHADRLEPLVRRLDVTSVFNADHASGMASSVRAGLSTVRLDCRGVLVSLADQVAVTPDDMRRLISCWQAHPERIAAARYDDVVGVPAIFPRPTFEQLKELQGDRGARELLKREAGQVIGVPMPSAAVDVDTPADLHAVPDRGLDASTRPTVRDPAKD